MKLRKIIKKEARLALRGNRGLAVGLILTAFAVSAVINLVDAAVFQLLGYTFTMESLHSFQYSANFFYQLPALLITVATLLVRLILVVPLGYGMVNWYLELSDRRRHSIAYIFWPYETRSALRGILLTLNRFVKTLGVGILLLALPVSLIFSGDIPELSPLLSRTMTASGLILTAVALILLWAFQQRFAIAPILLGEKYQMTTHQAVKLSVRFMKGHQWELVRFQLSFLPWMLPLFGSAALLAYSVRYDAFSLMPGIWLLLTSMVALVTYLTLSPYYLMSVTMYARYLYEYGLWQQSSTDPATTVPAEPAAHPQQTPEPSAVADVESVPSPELPEEECPQPDISAPAEAAEILPPTTENPENMNDL